MNRKRMELLKELGGRGARENGGRVFLSGCDAAVLGAGTNPHLKTGDGVLVMPSEAEDRGRAKLRDKPCGRLPEFYPSDPEEAYRMARAACLYADTYRTPILIRLAYEVRFGMAEIAVLRESAPEKRRGDYRPGSAEGLPGAFSDSVWNRVSGKGSRGILVRGPAWLKLLEILNGYPAGRVMKLGTPWPFPEERIRDFLGSIRELLVLDEERGSLLTAVYAVKGKYELKVRIVPFYGDENSERDLREALAGFLGKEAEKRFLKIGTPPERSLWGMPYLPPVSPAEPYCPETVSGKCI